MKFSRSIVDATKPLEYTDSLQTRLASRSCCITVHSRHASHAPGIFSFVSFQRH